MSIINIDKEIEKFEKIFLGQQATLTVSCTAGALTCSGTVVKDENSDSYFVGGVLLALYKNELDNVEVTSRSIAFVYQDGSRATIRPAL